MFKVITTPVVLSIITKLVGWGAAVLVLPHEALDAGGLGRDAGTPRLTNANH